MLTIERADVAEMHIKGIAPRFAFACRPWVQCRRPWQHHTKVQASWQRAWGGAALQQELLRERIARGIGGIVPGDPVDDLGARACNTDIVHAPHKSSTATHGVSAHLHIRLVQCRISRLRLEHSEARSGPLRVWVRASHMLCGLGACGTQSCPRYCADVRCPNHHARHADAVGVPRQPRLPVADFAAEERDDDGPGLPDKGAPPRPARPRSELRRPEWRRG